MIDIYVFLTIFSQKVIFLSRSQVLVISRFDGERCLAEQFYCWWIKFLSSYVWEFNINLVLHFPKYILSHILQNVDIRQYIHNGAKEKLEKILGILPLEKNNLYLKKKRILFPFSFCIFHISWKNSFTTRIEFPSC